MFSPVFPGVAAYLLCVAFGKDLLSETNHWLLARNFWCDSCCCEVRPLKYLVHLLVIVAQQSCFEKNLLAMHLSLS